MANALCRHCGYPAQVHQRYDYCPWFEGEEDPSTQFEPGEFTQIERLELTDLVAVVHQHDLMELERKAALAEAPK